MLRWCLAPWGILNFQWTKNDIHGRIGIIQSHPLRYSSWGCLITQGELLKCIVVVSEFRKKKNTVYSVAKFVLEIPWRLRIRDVERTPNF